MKTFKITFNFIQWAGGRVAKNPSLSASAEDADAAQEIVIGLLEEMGAAHGTILSICQEDSLPASGIYFSGMAK